MSRTLVVIRHAKAEHGNPGGDHERELAPRGVEDAGALGRWLAGEGLLPDLVLVSTAVRTRQTAELVLQGAGLDAGQVPTWPSRGVYDGGVDATLAAVQEADDDATTVWLVGHQPVVSTLALELAEPHRSDHAVIEAVGAGFPTSAAAVLRTDVDSWSGLGPGGARLVGLRPRNLG
ncbi:histidine phosphatase family protein [uncultured Ornithinimicrobium sp.]|uniref:SixA phosphatase family protein n=1 Tax=uncultured Ornithinimicrobium sp. TaxID=259307 RepID=UPI0025918A03|nr:histidine phosphatase family protein [uncultured Ornithinimicrobium sp.]